MGVKAEKVIENIEISYFQAKILNWYLKNGRQFPWRKSSASNYKKIISEVLLQRTKAETVAKYFPQFIKKYPSWNKLGEASEQDLQEILRPLGLHKQRGKRLFGLAQELKKRKGIFPKERNQVEDISMMGQYLTNAYELFILNKPAPLLDVNMSRVLERYFGPRKLADIRYDPYLQDLAIKVVNQKNAKEINWAILDFAALMCTARNAKCEFCQLKIKCLFYLKTSSQTLSIT